MMKSITAIEAAGTTITKATPGDTINVAFPVRLDPGYVFDDSCRAYWNGQQNTARISGSADNERRFVFKVTVPEAKRFDYYIDRVQITGANKDDVLGDGMLYVDVGTENTALFAPGGIVTVSEEAEVNLFGCEALNLSYTDENVVVKDNASLYCYAYQRNNGCDGTVDSKDVLLRKRAAAGLAALTSEQKSNADVNRDGSIDSKDVLLLKRAAAGLVTLN